MEQGIEHIDAKPASKFLKIETRRRQAVQEERLSRFSRVSKTVFYGKIQATLLSAFWSKLCHHVTAMLSEYFFLNISFQFLAPLRQRSDIDRFRWVVQGALSVGASSNGTYAVDFSIIWLMCD